jgi:tRNA (guanosine-2'-O-)-methyltransferase
MRKNYDEPIPEPPIDPLLIDDKFHRTSKRLARLRSTIESRQFDLHLVLENVHDPHNVSAVLRTCDAVGVGTVHLVYTDEQFPKIGKASSTGAYKWINLERHLSIEDCYARLREEKCQIFATDLTNRSQSLFDLDLTSPVALVFGNEHRGISSEASRLADGNIRIPMVGLIQSLNISVACAVTLYEAMRQRVTKGMYEQSRLSEAEIEKLVEEWAKK